MVLYPATARIAYGGGDMSLRERSKRKDGEREEISLLEQLIAATKLYDSNAAIEDLFEFAINSRAFAPYNAMLLHIQKPGLTNAATAADWSRMFNRFPKKDARPLVVLRTMGPVDFVFDQQDTYGDPLPENAFTFPTLGALSESGFEKIEKAVAAERIEIKGVDLGDGYAGYIQLLIRSIDGKLKNSYRLVYNRNHEPPTRCVTVAHELAHLFHGHLGIDEARKVKDRSYLPKDRREVEAETTAYLVARRHGLKPKSEKYLSTYKDAFSKLNLYRVMRTANQVETAMGIAAHKLWKDKVEFYSGKRIRGFQER